MTICCDVYPDDFTNIVIIVSLVIHGLLDVLCCFYFVAPVDCWGSGPVACTRYTALLFLRFRRMAAFPVLLLIVGDLVPSPCSIYVDGSVFPVLLLTVGGLVLPRFS